MAGNRQQFTLQFNADTSQAKKAIQQLTQDLNKVINEDVQSLHLDLDVSKAAKSAKELQRILAKSINTNTGKVELSTFNAELQKSNTSVRELGEALSRAGANGQAALSSLATSLNTAEHSLKRSKTLLTEFANTIKNTARWELSSSIVHGLESAFSQAISYAKNLNTSLTNIRIVTNASIDDMTRFTQEANRAAKSLSTTTKAYADASLIYYQQGDSAEQAAKKAAITIKAANSSFNTSAAEMSEYLTAVWNSYQVGADELERYVDIMAALGAKTATSLEEIATSMQKVAATANTVGVSMEQVSSIISTVSSVTRESAESIGTSYKTIFARIGDLKLGETLEDGINLGSVSSELDKIGVKILDTNGQMRDMGSIIEDLGSKWQDMTRAEQTAIAQVVAGKRQYTQLMALFENWNMYQTNMDIASSAEGSLQEMADTYAESWEAASSRVTASMETIYDTLINDQAIIKLTNALNTILEVVNGLIEGFGGFAGIIANVGMILTKNFSSNISNSIIKVKNNIVDFVKAYKDNENGFRAGFWKGEGLNRQQRKDLSNLQGLREINKKQRGRLESSTLPLAEKKAQTDILTQEDTLLAKRIDLIKHQNSMSSAAIAARTEEINLLAQELAQVQQLSQEYSELAASKLSDNQLTKEMQELAQQEREKAIQEAKTAKEREKAQAKSDEDYLKRAFGKTKMSQGSKGSLATPEGYAEQRRQLQQQMQESAMYTALGETPFSFFDAVGAEYTEITPDLKEALFRQVTHLQTLIGDSFKDNPNASDWVNDLFGLETLLGQQESIDMNAFNAYATNIREHYNEAMEDAVRRASNAQADWGLMGDGGKAIAAQAQKQAEAEARAYLKFRSQYSQNIQNMNDDNKDPKESTFDKMAKALPDVMTGIEGAVAGFTSINSIFDNWEDSSPEEKIGQIAGAVGTLANSFASGGWIGLAVTGVAMIGSAIWNAVENVREGEKELRMAAAARIKEDVAAVQSDYDLIIAQEEKYKSLKESFEEGTIAHDEYVNGLAEVASSLEIEGASVMALTGNYIALEEAIQNANQQRMKSTTADALIAQKMAKQGMSLTFEESATNSSLNAYTYGGQFVFEDFFNNLWNEGKGQGGLKSSDAWSQLMQDSDLRSQYGISGSGQNWEMMAALLGGTSTAQADGALWGLDWFEIDSGNFGIDQNPETMLMLYENLVDLQEWAASDDAHAAAIDAWLSTPQMQALWDIVNSTVTPYLQATEIWQMSSARDLLNANYGDLDATTYTSQTRDEMINAVLTDWGISPEDEGALADQGRLLAAEMVDSFLLGVDEGLAAEIETSKMASETKTQLSDYGKFRNANFDAGWYAGLSDEELAALNVYDLDYTSQEAFQASAQQSANRSDAVLDYQQGQSLLGQFYSGDYDIDTLGAQLVNFFGGDLEAFNNATMSEKVQMVLEYIDLLNGNMDGYYTAAADSIQATNDGIQERTDQLIREGQEFLQTIYGEDYVPDFTSDQQMRDFLKAGQGYQSVSSMITGVNQDQDGATSNIYTVASQEMGLTDDQIYRAALVQYLMDTYGLGYDTANSIVTNANGAAEITWYDGQGNSYSTTLDAVLGGRGLKLENGAYTATDGLTAEQYFNAVGEDGENRRDALAFGLSNDRQLQTTYSATNVATANRYVTSMDGMTPYTEDVPQRTAKDIYKDYEKNLKNLLSIDLDASTWSKDKIGANLATLGLTGADALRFLRGNQEIGAKAQLTQLQETYAKMQETGELTAEDAALYESQIAEVQSLVDSFDMSAVAHSLTILQEQWTNISNAAMAAGSAMSSVLADLSNWTNLSNAQLVEMQHNFETLGLGAQFEAYQTSMDSLAETHANDNQQYRAMAQETIRMQTAATLTQNEALREQKSLISDIMSTRDQDEAMAITNRQYDAELKAVERAELDRIRNQALNNLGLTHQQVLESDSTVLQNEVWKEMQRIYNLEQESIQIQIEGNTASLEDSWMTAIQNVYALEEQAATEIFELWQNTFNAIADARQGLAEGKSIIETMFGNPEQLGLIVAQMLAADKTMEQIRADLYNGEMDYQDVQFENFSAKKYAGQSQARFFEFDGENLAETEYEDYQANLREDVSGQVDSYRTIIENTPELLSKAITEGLIAADEQGNARYDRRGNIIWNTLGTNELVDAIVRTVGYSEDEFDAAYADVYAQQLAAEYWRADESFRVAQTNARTEVQESQDDYDQASQNKALVDKAYEMLANGQELSELSAIEQESLMGIMGVSSLAEIGLEDLGTQSVALANQMATAAEIIASIYNDVLTGYEQNGNGSWTNEQTGHTIGDATYQEWKEVADTATETQEEATTVAGTQSSTNIDIMKEGYASQVNMEVEAFEDLADSLYKTAGYSGELSEASEDLQTEYYNLAKRVAEVQNAWDDLCESQEESIDLIKSGNKAHPKYASSLKAVTKDIKKIFGNSLKDTEGFVEDNIDLIEDMADGVEGAAEDVEEAFLRAQAAQEGWDYDKEIEINFDVDNDGITDQLTTIGEMLNNFADQHANEPVGFVATVDNTPAIAGLNQVLSAGIMTADQITAALNAIGWEPEITWEEHTGTAQQAQEAHGYVKTLEGYEPIGEEINSEQTITYYIPKIGSVTKTGGGASGLGSKGGKGKGGGGGGGGSKPKKLDKKEPEDEKERYHETEQTLERLADELEKVDKLKSRAYGKGHLDAIKQEIGLLKQEIGLQQDYIKQAQAYLKIDRNRVASLGATFNADGTISNYDELIDSIVAKYNAFIEKYNAASASAQEDMEEEKEEMDEWFDEAMEWISQYEDTLNIIRDKENEILELQNEISAKTLEGIQYKVEFEVELNEEEVDFLDYLNEKYSEVLEKQDEMVENLVKQQQLAQENLGYLNNAKAELDAKFASGELNQADYVAGLQDINDQILENLSTLEELRKEIQEAYGNALEMASEAIDNHTEKMEHASQVMQSYISIMGLIGKGIDYDKLSDYYDKQYTYNLKSLETQQQYLEVLKEEESYYLAKLAAGDLTETERIQFEALQDTIAEVEDGILAKTEETLSALREAFSIAIEGILRDFEESVAGSGNTLEDLAADYEYYLEVQERHVSTSKELYEISKLNRQIEQDIADTSSSVYKQRLATLQEEIKAKSADRALTEYDIQMMNLEYELLQRQMALEEAKNAKDTVRLTRDSSGNYVYQYTADQDAISEAQQGVEDVLQQMAEANAERVTQLEQETINTYQNMVSQIEEIANSEVLTQEEKNAKIAEIVAQAQEKMLWLQDQYGIATENTMATNALIQDHYNTDMITNAQISSEAMNETIAAIINKSAELSDGMATMQEQIGQEMAELEYDINTVLNTTAWDDAGEKISTYDQVVDDATTEVDEMIDTLSGEDGLLDSIKDTTAAWDAQAAAIDALIKYYEDLYVSITRAQNAQANVTNPSTGGSVTDPGTDTEAPEEEEETPEESNKVQYQGGTWKFYTYGQESGGKKGAIFYGNGKAPVVTKEDEGDNRIKISGEDGKGNTFSSRWIAKVHRGKELWKAYAMGGLVDYTGPAWVDGTKSQPELMLNATDTQNMLAAVQTVRALDSATLNMLDEFIKLATSSMLSADNLHASGVASTDTELQQQVQITAEFPNVQDSNEIQDAFDNLINRAAQYIGSKK